MQQPSFTTLLSHFTTQINRCKALLPLEKGVARLLDKSEGWKPLRIGDLVAPTPIVQGGMGVGISLSGLASAVANAGGIGVIAANGIGMIEKGYFQDGEGANIRALRSEIQRARELTDGIIGVNIMVAVADFSNFLEVCIEERVDIVFLGAGLPIKGIPVARLREANIKVAPIVSSARAADMIFRMWEKLYGDRPDAVVLEGPKAGGHLGFTAEQIADPAYRLEALIPQLLEVIAKWDATVPLIAGGGIYSGSDVHRILALGASAVQMGTRFVATQECDASSAFKQTYLTAKRGDIGLIESPVGMLGRAIRNTFILDSEAGIRPSFRCAYPCLSTCKAQEANYCISIALNNARKGNLESGFVFAGTNAWRIQTIVPVAQLVATLERGYRRAKLAKFSVLVGRFETLADEYAALEAKLSELYRSAGLGVRVGRQCTQALAALSRLRAKMGEALVQATVLLA